MTQDFNIKVTVRNGRLLRAIREKFDSAAELARVAGVNQSQVTALVTMRARPILKDGNLSSAAEAIVSALGVPADELWPEHIRRLKSKRATVEVEMDAQTFAEIALGNSDQSLIYRQAIKRWAGCLSDREKGVLSARYGGVTLDELASEQGVGRERIRQIEHKAIVKMRKAAFRDKVHSMVDLAE